jgi:hypothetical protein
MKLCTTAKENELLRLPKLLMEVLYMVAVLLIALYIPDDGSVIRFASSCCPSFALAAVL